MASAVVFSQPVSQDNLLRLEQSILTLHTTSNNLNKILTQDIEIFKQTEQMLDKAIVDLVEGQKTLAKIERNTRCCIVL